MDDLTANLLFISFIIPKECIKLIIAFLMGAVIGLERLWNNKVASIKTFSFITAGSCLFSIISLKAAAGVSDGSTDSSRIAAQVVSGIGFVGAGVIFKGNSGIKGITTASMIWLSAALGMAIAFELFILALWGMIMTFVIQFGARKIATIRYKNKLSDEVDDDSNEIPQHKKNRWKKRSKKSKKT